jgi:hypothetical protein
MAATELIAGAAWERAWSGSYGKSDVRRLWPGTGKTFVWTSELDEIEAVFGELRQRSYRSGYRQVSNGATPLLKRRDPDWIREVLLRVGPRTASGALLGTIDLHLSSRRLAETRKRYWSRTKLGLPHVASKNLGELMVPHCRILVDLVDLAAPTELADQLIERGIPWLEESTRPEGWVLEPVRGLTPGSPFDPVTTFELILAHQGWGPAGVFLEALSSKHPGLLQPGFSYPEVGRLRAAAIAYEFI